jgi:hypothetical protein
MPLNIASPVVTPARGQGRRSEDAALHMPCENRDRLRNETRLLFLLLVPRRAVRPTTLLDLDDEVLYVVRTHPWHAGRLRQRMRPEPRELLARLE